MGEVQSNRIQSVLQPTQKHLDWDDISSLTSEEQALNKTPLLIFADKLNEEGSKTPSEIWNHFHVNDAKYEWHLQGINLLTGEGIDEGMEWLKKAIQPKIA